MSSVRVCIAGGQTGVDRGAFDAAEQLGLARDGWAPLNYRAEDGRIPEQYARHLRESEFAAYPVRTRLNVAAADAVIVVTLTDEITPGSKMTIQMAKRERKLVFHAALDTDRQMMVPLLEGWLEAVQPKALMVAGSRESKAPGIQKATCELLVEVLRGTA